MRGTMRPTEYASKSKTESRLLMPDLRSRFAKASHNCTLGVVKIVAAFMRLTPSVVYEVNHGERPGHAEMLARKMDAALSAGRPERDALGELFLLCRLFGYNAVPESAACDALEQSVADAAREGGEVVAITIEKMRDGLTPDECASVEREADEAIAKLYKLKQSARTYSTSSNVRSIKGR